MKKIIFPKKFLWGAGISAEQSEGYGGKKAPTIYKKHFEDFPNDFIDNIGPNKTSDVFKYYKEDILMYKEMKFNSFRTSFSWSRLFPDGMDANPSKEAINFYHSYIDECLKNDIEFIGTLFHFDLPLYEWEKGGWESEEVINDFLKYANFVFREFGRKINKFITFCEPFIPAINGFINGRHFPKIKSFKRGISVAFGIILAHAKVVNLFNEEYKNKKNMIGCIFDPKKAIPASKEKKDLDAAKVSNYLFYTGMTDAMISGKFSDNLMNFVEENNYVPKLFGKDKLNIISKIKIDFYGINFYAPHRIRAANNINEFDGWFEKYLPKNFRMNVFRGIEIRPESLYELIIDLDKRYKLPLYISENGMGVENEELFRENNIIRDDYRISFIKEHLFQVHRAIEKGVDVFGYHLWASIDNWSWINAYKNRYGLIEINLDNQKRIMKKSGYWFKELVLNNGFSTPFQSVEETLKNKNIKYTKNN